MPRKTFTYEGKRYDVTAATREDLAVKIAFKKKELEEGTAIINKNTTVEKWVWEWLETYKSDSISPITYNDYKSRLKSHILPQIGQLKLKDVKPIHLQKILNGMAGSSKDYIHKMENTLKQIFGKAVSNKLIASNPAVNLEKPKAVNGTRRAITDKEREYILKVAETHRGGLWVKTMLYCGLRPGETSLIQGRHLDLENKIMKVEGTKTAAAKRIVPIPETLLMDFKKSRFEPYEYIFKNNSGGQLSKANMRIMWLNFKREMNIQMGCRMFRNELIPPYPVSDDLVPYCLRHTYCTDLQAAGVPINVAKELMGHTDISVTARIYTHHSKAAFESAANAINKLHRGEACGSSLEKC